MAIGNTPGKLVLDVLVYNSTFHPSVFAKRFDEIPTMIVSFRPIIPPPVLKSTAVHPLHAGDVAVSTD
jgi:hypothetical protein